MVIDSREVQSNEELREEIKEYFRILYCEEFECKPKVDDINVNMLDKMSSESLERDFSEEEVYEGLMHCNKNRTPGLNGFNMASCINSGI